jgi:hypothetical protein
LRRQASSWGRNTNDCDQVFAEAHSSSTDEEQTTATDSVNCPDTRDGHSDVDDVGGDLDKEGVLDAGVLEERGAVVEDEVDTGKLLPSELQEESLSSGKQKLDREKRTHA